MDRSIVLAIAALAVIAPRARAQERLVSLAEILAYADEHAPRMVVARARLAEADAEREGAEPLLVDPLRVEFAVGPRVQSQTQPDYDLQLSVIQPIEIAGERGARLAVAAGVGDRRAAELEAARWEVHREVHFAFHEAIEAQVRLDAAERWLALARRVEDVARARHGAGDVGAIEVMIAEAERAGAEQERVAVQHVLEAARLRIAELAGWPASRPPRPAGGLDAPRDVTPLAVLLARALERHPAIAAQEAAAREAQAQLELADREAWPTIDLGLSLQREGSTGTPAAYIGFVTLGVSVPVWHQNAAQRARARAALAVADAQVEALRGIVEARVRRARASVIASADRVAIFTADVLPRFERNLELLGRAYEIGEIDATALLAARERLLRVQGAALEAFAQYHAALADLEAEVGDEVISDVSHEIEGGAR